MVNQSEKRNFKYNGIIGIKLREIIAAISEMFQTDEITVVSVKNA